MTRGLTSAMQTAIADGLVRPVYLVKIEWDGISTYYSSTLGKDISFGGETWLGNGVLTGIGGIDETTNTDANGFEFELIGADSAIISAVLGDTNQRFYGYFFLGLLDSSEALIADPIELARGLFDYAEINDDGTTVNVVLHYESELLEMKRIQEFRYTNESQQVLFPSDIGFEYSALTEDWNGFWGRAARPKKARKRKKGRN